jgi:hypothetical protein
MEAKGEAEKEVVVVIVAPAPSRSSLRHPQTLFGTQEFHIKLVIFNFFCDRGYESKTCSMEEKWIITSMF